MAKFSKSKNTKKSQNTKSPEGSSEVDKPSEADSGVRKDVAFLKALQDGDIDQIHSTLLDLRAKTTPADFLKTIRNFPSALSLYKNYCKICNVQNLYEIYIKEKDFNALAEIFIIHTLTNTHASLSDAAEAYRKSRNNFCLSVCEEQLNLLEFQRQLNEKISEENFIGKTVHETCRLLLKYDVNLAETFKDEYKISDRRFCWLKMQYLVDTGKWDKLRTLSEIENCPLGVDSFIDICLQIGKTKEALKYLPNVDKKMSVKYHIKCGLLQEAARLAFRKKDEFSLLLIRSKCKPRSQLFKRVNSYISRL